MRAMTYAGAGLAAALVLGGCTGGDTSSPESLRPTAVAPELPQAESIEGSSYTEVSQHFYIYKSPESPTLSGDPARAERERDMGSAIMRSIAGWRLDVYMASTNYQVRLIPPRNPAVQQLILFAADRANTSKVFSDNRLSPTEGSGNSTTQYSVDPQTLRRNSVAYSVVKQSDDDPATVAAVASALCFGADMDISKLGPLSNTSVSTAEYGQLKAAACSSVSMAAKQLLAPPDAHQSRYDIYRTAVATVNKAATANPGARPATIPLVPLPAFVDARAALVEIEKAA